MAHIEKRGPKRWRARYRAPDGRERSRTFARRIDAERFLASVETRKATGEWVDPRLSQTTLGEWVDDWKSTTVHLKPKTRAGYDSHLRTCILPTFEDAPLGRIESVHVKEWIAELIENGLSPSRVRQAYQLLSAVLKAAVESGYLARSPCIGIRLPRIQPREMLFLSAHEVERLAAVVEEPYGTLVHLLAYGGLRWGEAAAFRRSRCDLLRSRIEVAESLAEVSGELHFGPTKTYQRRTIAVPSFFREMLTEHLKAVDDDPDALVFTAPEGGPLRHANFRNRVWLPTIRAAGLPEKLRIHDLRHTCAALLIAQGAHPKAIQVHLGHSSIIVTLDRYGHLFPDDMDRLAEGLDATRRAASAEIPAASPRPALDESVIDIEKGKQKKAADQRLRKWGRLDSNQRPTDYESSVPT